MALVDCPDCGRSISDSAPSCIGCGRPMVATGSGRNPSTPPVKKSGWSWMKKGLVGAALLILLLVILGKASLPGEGAFCNENGAARGQCSGENLCMISGIASISVMKDGQERTIWRLPPKTIGTCRSVRWYCDQVCSAEEIKTPSCRSACASKLYE